MSKDNFWDKYSLAVEEGEVEVGKVYPLYGMITKIIDESFEKFTVEINFGIVLRCTIKDVESANKIKERAFENGIFVTEITNKEPVQGNCTTIVFGKRQNSDLT